MGCQVLLAPLLIGLNSYGFAMTIMSPVFIFQGLLEPLLQTLCNSSSDSKVSKLEYSANVTFSIVAIGFFVGLVSCLIVSEASYIAYVAVLVHALSYGLLTQHITARLAEGKSYMVGWIQVVGMFGYAIALISFHSLGYLAMLVASSSATSASLALYCLLSWQSKNVGTRKKIMWFGALRSVNAVLIRLPLLGISSIPFMILGLSGRAMDGVGDVRLLISFLGSTRYLNRIPLAVCQLSIHRWFANLTSPPSTNTNADFVVLKKYITDSSLIIIALSILIIPIFKIIYSRPPLFGVFEVVSISSMIAIQPLTYAIYVLSKDCMKRFTATLSVSSLFIAAFSSWLIWTGTDFGVTLGATSALTFIILAASFSFFYFVRTKNE